jgi:hypothetical protein
VQIASGKDQASRRAEVTATGRPGAYLSSQSPEWEMTVMSETHTITRQVAAPPPARGGGQLRAWG